MESNYVFLNKENWDDDCIVYPSGRPEPQPNRRPEPQPPVEEDIWSSEAVHPTRKPELQPPVDDESWDNEEFVPTYNIAKAIEGRNIIRSCNPIINKSKTEKKAYRYAERGRLYHIWGRQMEEKSKELLQNK